MSEDSLKTLLDGVNQWRQVSVGDYWIRVGYMGADLSKVGEHEVTRADGKLWHSKDGGDWIEVPKGSSRWLFGVEGTFVWTRDVMTRLLPKADAGPEAVQIRCNADFGYVEYLRVDLHKRDAENLTLEVKEFGLGAHPEM